jgi:hypothetical protein
MRRHVHAKVTELLFTQFSVLFISVDAATAVARDHVTIEIVAVRYGEVSKARCLTDGIWNLPCVYI